jgi:hypothetical protein
VWMMVILKIPVAALLYLVWWSSRAPEGQDEEPARVDRGSPHRPDHPRTRRPHPPRRGPHAEPAPRPPTRVRAHARGMSRPRHLR